MAPKRDKTGLTGWLLLAIWVVVVFRILRNIWPIDLSALIVAGFAWGTNQTDLIYAAPPGVFTTQGAPAWEGLRAAMGLSTAENLTPYIYPPIWAAMMAPLALRLDPWVLVNIIQALQLVLLVATVALLWDLTGRVMRFVYWVILSLIILTFSAPGVISLALSQPQIIVGFLVAMSFWLSMRGKPLRAGAALGLAAAFKVTPFLLVAVYLRNRQWRAAAACVAVTAGLAGLSVLVAGWPLHLQYLERLRELSSLTAISSISDSLPVLLHELAGRSEDWGAGPRPGLLLATDPVVPPAWLPALQILLLAVMLLPATDLADPVSYSRMILRVLLALPLFMPLAWAHYYLLPFLMLPALPAMIGSRSGTVLAMAVALAGSQPVFTLLHQLPTRQFYAVIPLTGAVVVLAAVLLARSLRNRG